MLFKTLALVIGLSVLPVFAGGESGGGGDSLEERVSDIRADILKWINAGGSRALKLPVDVAHEDYVSLMTDILQPQKVVVGFDDADINVGGVSKTCRGFISQENSRPHILCNIARFKATSESDQYRLIHHEYAGLVRIEKNDGAASDYEISSQITDYLRVQTILRLAVVNETPGETEGFDPLVELKKGQASYNEVLKILAADEMRLEEAKKGYSEISSRLQNYVFPSAVVQESIRACSKNFSEYSSKFSKIHLDESKEIFDEATKNLNALEYYVKVYTEALACRQCEPNTRKKTMNEFKRYMKTVVHNLGLYIYHGNSLSDYSLEISQYNLCPFKKHFTIYDGTNMDNYDHNGTYTERDTSLSPKDILEGTYDDALKVIGQNSPVNVYRSAPKFLKPTSSFNGKAVKVRFKFDKKFMDFGYSYLAPLSNPIKIIQRDLR